MKPNRLQFPCSHGVVSQLSLVSSGATPLETTGDTSQTTRDTPAGTSRSKAVDSRKALILHDRYPAEKFPFAGRLQRTHKTRVVTVCHTSYDADGYAHDEWSDE